MSNHIYIPRPVNPIYYPEYGLLYNTFTFEDTRKITSSDDWDVMEYTVVKSLITATGGLSFGGDFKSTGTIYFNTPNLDASNIYGFNARGSGYRNTLGVFNAINTDFRMWARKSSDPNDNYRFVLSYLNGNWISYDNEDYTNGLAIRLGKSAPGVPDGTITTYTGNDGKTYLAVAINQVYWLQYNLAETRLRDGSIIPWYGADPANYFTNAEWAALTTAGCCAYNNTLSNVGPGFTFPT